jgi:hypothetical protein
MTLPPVNLKGRPPGDAHSTRVFWSRLWAIAKVLGPSAVAITALIISLLSYKDQHKADEAVAAASLRQQAELVNFFQSEYNGAVQIDNYSDEPVTKAELMTDVTFGRKTYALSIGIGSMPACSTGSIKASALEEWQSSLLLSLPNGGSQRASKGPVLVSSMLFTDNNGNNWRYLAGGPLETSVPSHDPYGPSLVEAIQETPDKNMYDQGLITIFPSYNQKGPCAQL